MIDRIKRLLLVIRHSLEYAGARIVLAIVDSIPLEAAVALARFIGASLYRCGFRRRIVIDNLMRSGVVTDLRQANYIGQRSFESFAIMIVESLKSAPLFQSDAFEKNVQLEVSEEGRKILMDPRQPVILASGHYGNWEAATQWLSMYKPVAGVSRPMSNPWTERLIQKRKPRMQLHIIPKHDANMLRFLSILKDGEMLALMIDQHSGSRGAILNFLGRPASTHTAIALLHLVTRTPLFFGYCRRTGLLRYEIKAIGPMTWKPTGDKDADVRGILQWLNAELEKVVREDPGQYLWAHRRWKVKENIAP